MSMPDLWSPAALSPRPRKVETPRAIVPRERVYGRRVEKKAQPSPAELAARLAANRSRERQEALAAAWREGFRAAEAKYAVSIEYETGDYAALLGPTMAMICAEVARKHDLRMSDIKGPRRRAAFVGARQEVMYRCYHEMQTTLPQIGRFLGNRDHTTILHGIRRHAERLAKEGEAK